MRIYLFNRRNATQGNLKYAAVKANNERHARQGFVYWLNEQCRHSGDYKCVCEHCQARSAFELGLFDVREIDMETSELEIILTKVQEW